MASHNKLYPLQFTTWLYLFHYYKTFTNAIAKLLFNRSSHGVAGLSSPYDKKAMFQAKIPLVVTYPQYIPI